MEKKELYDHSIKYDTSHLPKFLQEEIKLLETYDKNNDFINYDALSSAMEGHLKNYLLNKKITERDFKIMMRKYGGYVD